MASWEHFSHEADIGVRGRGESPDAAFEQAALALTAAITDLALVQRDAQVDIRCHAPRLDILFVDWLNAIIYEMTTRSMLFREFEVRIEGQELRAQVRGESVDRKRHQPVVEPKGATFTELLVTQEDDGQWVAQCIVDV
ncbi:MAG: archease [Myxococcales bacterium SG8_38]|nr:MAG: archease [Myxococcales bacterium SG8_38]